MRCSSFHTKGHRYVNPQLYRQLQVQLNQWICLQDQQHLQVFCENVAAILLAQSAWLIYWLPYLSHQDCQARSPMECLNYFVYIIPKLLPRPAIFGVAEVGDVFGCDVLKNVWRAYSIVCNAIVGAAIALYRLNIRLWELQWHCGHCNTIAAVHNAIVRGAIAL